MRTGRPPQPLFERFVSKIQLNPDTGCWEWLAGKSPAGYGVFVIRSELTVLSHRLAYEWFVGPIPEGHDIHHKCRNRACICPQHLNALSRSSHGREHQCDQEFCRHGHRLTEDNLLHYTTPSGKPRWKCKQCSRDQQKARLIEYRKVVPPKPHASSAKTHCKRGHEFTPENTRITVAGSRQCRICYAMLQKRWKDKQPAKPSSDPITHCKRGHELTPDNVKVYGGSRHCIKCTYERIAAYRARKRMTFINMPGGISPPGS